MLAKAVIIKGDEIKYRLCEDDNWNEFSLKKSEVDKIHRSNGEKEYFYADETVSTGSAGQGRNGANGIYNPITPASRNSPDYGYSNTYQGSSASITDQADKTFIQGILSFVPYIGVVFGILAIRSGNKALAMMKGNAGYNTRDYKRAKNGRIFGLVTTAIRAFFLFIIIMAVIAAMLI